MKKIEINIPHDQPIALAIVEAFKDFSESINVIAESITAAPAPATAAATAPPPATALPPATAAPAAPAAPPAAAPAGVVLDAAGMPWDARIHAGSKARLKKTDLWRKKKGVDAALVEQVEAELKATMTAPAPAPAAATAPPAVTAPPPAAAPPPAPPAATAPPPAVEHKYDVNGQEFTREQLIGAGWEDAQIDALPIVESNPVNITFPVLMQHITNAVTLGHMTDEHVNQIVTGAGVASLALLAARPDLIPTVYSQLFDE